MKKSDFNRGWMVHRDGENIKYNVNLPHDAMLYEKRDKNNSTGSACAWFPGGKYIYEKTWDITEERAKGTSILEFEGVYQNAQVSINGEVICRWPYGYTNFFVDLSDRLHAGKNYLEVIADNGAVPNTRWYSGSGIYREVYLYEGQESFIHPQGIQVHVIDTRTIQVITDASIQNGAYIHVQIFSQEGNIVAEAEGENCIVCIPDARVWSAEKPYLYRCSVSIKKEGNILDSAQVSFGVRTINWNGNGLYINGERIKLRGGCIHHDNGILGACDFADAEFRRIRILKKAGFNAIRSAHNPISKAMLDACDKLGMYVMDEAFDMWQIHKNSYDYAGKTFQEWWKRDLDAMITKDYNHPSVIMYSIGNETTELGEPSGWELAERMVRFCHVADDSRPVTAGSNIMLNVMASWGKGIYSKEAKKDDQVQDDGGSITPNSTFFNALVNRIGRLSTHIPATKSSIRQANAMHEIFDIPGYNYAPFLYAKDALDRPVKPVVGTESFPLTLYANWQYMKKLPNVIGDFIWSAWDYLGESGIATVEYQTKDKKPADEGLVISGGAGVIDICGYVRPEAKWNEVIWGLRKEPVIGVRPLQYSGMKQFLTMWKNTDTVESWSWRGFEGKSTTVTVYSDAPRVELLVNGKSYGKQKTHENMAQFSNVVYQPGELKAIALDKTGQIISSSTLTTAKGKLLISLKPDKTMLCSNGQDLCFLDIELIGEDGICESGADCLLHIEVTGAGTLQGFGSARPHMKEDFYHPEHTTYYGRALAVIRAGYEPGTIHIRVSGKNMESVELHLNTKER